MSAIRHAVILAAGRGARMGPLTDVIPKPMAPFNGTTLIANGIRKLLESIPEVHITVGYKKAMLAQHVIENGAASVINTEGHHNAWWIYNSLLRHLDEPLYVLTCDNITDMDFASLEKAYFDQGAPPCMLVPVTPVAGLDGDYIFHDDEYVVSEVNRHKRAEIYCSGVQILNPKQVNERTREEGDFYTVWNQLIAQRALKVSTVKPRKWFTVDTLEHLAHASAHAQ